MKPVQPILIAHLFPEIHAGLLDLLKSLSESDWQQPTVCAGWSVKDVALHLLGGEIGNLSRRRDGIQSTGAPIRDWQELVGLINTWNQDWVLATRRISPRLLIDLLELVGSQMNDYFQSLDPFATGGAVSWAGPEPAPVWLDLAREYTERWHHQQHIRDAVGQPGLKQERIFAPVLDAFMRALPHTYRDMTAEEGACLTVSLSGPGGGRWSLLRQGGAWQLYAGAPETSMAEVLMEADVAWRIFTRGLTLEQAVSRITITGDHSLGAKALETVSIIA